MKKNRKAQLFGMPFSTIFSILLIAIFIVVAFFAIRYFLNIRKCSEMGLFVDDFKGEVESAWQSQSSSKTFVSTLPSGIEHVCFADLSAGASGTNKEREIYQELRKNADYTANLFFYPQREACLRATNIEYVNVTELTNPYCFEVRDKRVEIRIEKGFFDALVKVSR